MQATANNHLVRKDYVDDKTKGGHSHSLTNTLKYIMDDRNEISTGYGWVSDKIDNLSWSFHSNKKVLYFRATNDGSNNYRYRMGIQLGSASDKNHTVCIEQFFTDETLWNKAQITITGTGISIPYHQTNKFHYNVGSTEYYYTKTIVQVKKLTAVSHFIYYTTHIDNVTPPTPNQSPLHLVVYGVDSYSNDVDSSVYNLIPFKIVDDKIQTQEDRELYKAPLWLPRFQELFTYLLFLVFFSF